MTKDESLLGIWENLQKIYGFSELCQILDITTTQLIDIAIHPAKGLPSSDLTFLLEQICLLNGVKPRLYRYKGWEDFKGIFIASTPAGWKAWTLKNGYTKTTNWLGGMEELILANEAEVEQAKAHGWLADRRAHEDDND